MPDVLGELLTLSWRQIEVPYEKLDTGFSHDHAAHKFIFQDQALIQQLGRTNETFRCELPLFEGLQSIGYEGLFSVTFADFYNACLDRSPDILEHPVQGAVRCVVASCSYTLDPATHRDGVNLSVEFIAAPEENDLTGVAFALIPTLETAKRAGQEAAQAIADIPEFQDFQLAGVNPLDLISGIADQISLIRDKSFAQLDQIAGEVQQLENSFKNLTDPDKWNAQEKLKDFRLSIHKSRQNITSANRKFFDFLVTQPTPVEVIAASFQMGVQDFLIVNQDAVDNGMVAAGATVKVQQKGTSGPRRR